jgi:hypothetical protein
MEDNRMPTMMSGSPAIAVKHSKEHIEEEGAREKLKTSTDKVKRTLSDTLGDKKGAIKTTGIIVGSTIAGLTVITFIAKKLVRWIFISGTCISHA